MDLSTEYLGLKLLHPLVAGASPLADDLDSVKRLEDGGASAIVLRSLFEEQITREQMSEFFNLDNHGESFGEATSYFPSPHAFALGPFQYLEHIRRAKEAVGIPVMASLNGATPGGWLEYARLMAQAGADALELNLYHVAADQTRTAATIEADDLELIALVRACVTIPLAVKLSPFYSSMSNFASEACEAGADGLVLFNRFYQPDLDLETFDVVPRIDLSQSWEMRLPVRWIGILRPQLGLDISLAASSGAHTGADVIKGLMVGADVVMMTSSLLRHGPEHVATVEAEVRAWMNERDYESADQLRGSASQATAQDPSAFERANYMQTIRSWVALEG